MKIGPGLYRHMLTNDNLAFARQPGATHIVAHLGDYFSGGPRIPESTGKRSGRGPTHRGGLPWTLAEIEQVRDRVEKHGLVLHSIENLDPAHCHDVLLAGPKRDEQLEAVRESIRLLGQAGVRNLGYNFSLAGVWGHRQGPFARGGAESIGFDAATLGEQPEIPLGQVWNMDFDESLAYGEETIGEVSADELWAWIEYFLRAAVPVAEQADVRLCAHPDDPPLLVLRNAARVLSGEAGLQKRGTWCQADTTGWTSAREPSRRCRTSTSTTPSRASPRRTGSATCTCAMSSGGCRATTRCSSTRGTSTCSRRCVRTPPTGSTEC